MFGLISSFSLVYNELKYIRFSKFRRIFTTNLEFEGHVLSSSNVLVFLFSFFLDVLLWFGFLFSFFAVLRNYYRLVYTKFCLCIFLGKFHRDVS